VFDVLGWAFAWVVFRFFCRFSCFSLVVFVFGFGSFVVFFFFFGVFGFRLPFVRELLGAFFLSAGLSLSFLPGSCVFCILVCGFFAFVWFRVFHLSVRWLLLWLIIWKCRLLMYFLVCLVVSSFLFLFVFLVCFCLLCLCLYFVLCSRVFGFSCGFFCGFLVACVWLFFFLFFLFCSFCVVMF